MSKLKLICPICERPVECDEAGQNYTVVWNLPHIAFAHNACADKIMADGNAEDISKEVADYKQAGEELLRLRENLSKKN
jgi:hypothetical protein